MKFKNGFELGEIHASLDLHTSNFFSVFMKIKKNIHVHVLDTNCSGQQ